jgi:Xaa-Pro aminopeptidase
MTGPRDRQRVGRDRMTAAQAALADGGFDALLITTGTNLLFLSGYPFVEMTLARPFFLVVPRHGSPVLIVHAGREAEARRYAWIRDVRAYRELSVAPVAELRSAFRDLGIERGRIGVELGYEQRLGIPVLEFQRIQAEFARARFADAASLLWRLRMVKSPEDVAAIREACRITTAAYELTFQRSREGETDRVVAERMAGAMGDAGGERAWVLVTSGEGNYELATGVPVGRALERGDMVWFDSGCSVAGFWSDFSRAGVVGGPSPDQAEAQRLIWDATMAGVGLIRPGVPVAEVAGACNTRLHAVGIPVLAYTSDLAARIGHGIGYDITEPPHVSEADPTILEAGMVISVEPGFAAPDGLFHVEQNVLVTADGHEILSSSPGELQSIRAG